MAPREVLGTGRRWAKGWSWNGIQWFVCDNQIPPRSYSLTRPLFSPSPSHTVDRHPEIRGRFMKEGRAAERAKETGVQIPTLVWDLQCQTLGASPHFA